LQKKAKCSSSPSTHRDNLAASAGEADAGSFRVIESAAIAGGTFSAQLIPTLAALLKKHEYRAADIGGFAAASGRDRLPDCAWG